MCHTVRPWEAEWKQWTGITCEPGTTSVLRDSQINHWRLLKLPSIFHFSCFKNVTQSTISVAKILVKSAAEVIIALARSEKSGWCELRQGVGFDHVIVHQFPPQGCHRSEGKIQEPETPKNLKQQQMLNVTAMERSGWSTTQTKPENRI